MSEFNQSDFNIEPDREPVTAPATPKPKKRGLRLAAAITAAAVLCAALIAGGYAAGSLVTKAVANGSLKAIATAADTTATPVNGSKAQTNASSDQASDTNKDTNTNVSFGGTNTLTADQKGDVPKIVKAVGPSVVGVLNKVSGKQFSFGSTGQEQTQASGSGVIITSDGYIVTNNHVVAGGDSFSVVLADGTEVPADLVGKDAESDLAVLKIKKTGLTAMPLGDSDGIEVGETVIAIGNPLDGTELAGTVTEGILSAKNRKLTVDGYTFKLLQTDAAINPGNSGGALVNMQGELVGINNSKIVSAGGDSTGNTISAEGIGFAIPINTAKPIIDQLIKNGGIPRPMLGISPQEISADQASYYKVPQGVGVVSVQSGGPAMTAGLKAGDIIIGFDGKDIKTLADMRDALDAHKVGETVSIKVYRSDDGKEYTFQVTLGNSMTSND